MKLLLLLLLLQIDTVGILLQAIQQNRQFQFMLTEHLLEKTLNFVDKNGNSVLEQGAIVKVISLFNKREAHLKVIFFLRCQRK